MAENLTGQQWADWWEQHKATAATEEPVYDYTNRRLSGSVTERLATRLDEVEAVQARMMQNEAKLIADSLTTQAGLGAQRECCQERWDAQCETNGRFVRSHQAFVTRTLWQRLRWLVRGV